MNLSSCQDMNLMPKDQLPDHMFWNSPSDYMQEANKLYVTTETFGTKDTDSDIGYELQENSTSNGTWSAPSDDGVWDSAFENLRQSNTIIEKSKTYAGSAAEIEVYVAEARFFRAYSHWILMKRFNDIPIITKVLDADSPELYGSRKTQTEAEDFILSELEAIYSHLPLQSKIKGNEIGRVTQGAALTLKARVALFAGTWAKYHQHRPDYLQLLDQAIVAAEKVRSSGQYRLFEDEGLDSYRQLFIDKGDNASASEAIFDHRYYINIRMHSTAHATFWGQRGTPTKKLADMYLCKSTGLPITHPNADFRGYATIKDEFENRDPRMSQTFIMPGTKFIQANGPDSCVAQFATRPETRTGYKLWKFMGETKAGVNDATYNYHIMRYPEVLLILVEATYEKEGVVSDDLLKQTINVIRSRKGVEMPPLSNQFIETHGLNMQAEIRRERTIELAFEGFRRDDLRRWKIAEIELIQAVKGIKYKGTEYETIEKLLVVEKPNLDADGFLIIEPASNRFFAPKHYYYSLPLNELFLNPNLLPNNPGW